MCECMNYFLSPFIWEQAFLFSVGSKKGTEANPYGRARLKVKKTRTELQFSFGEKRKCRPYGRPRVRLKLRPKHGVEGKKTITSLIPDSSIRVALTIRVAWTCTIIYLTHFKSGFACNIHPPQKIEIFSYNHANAAGNIWVVIQISASCVHMHRRMHTVHWKIGSSMIWSKGGWWQ